jgi:hypothetical protein
MSSSQLQEGESLWRQEEEHLEDHVPSMCSLEGLRLLKWRLIKFRKKMRRSTTRRRKVTSPGCASWPREDLRITTLIPTPMLVMISPTMVFLLKCINLRMPCVEVTLVSKFHPVWWLIAQESSLGRKGQILRENHVFRDLPVDNVRSYWTMSGLTATPGGHSYSNGFKTLWGSFLSCWLVFFIIYFWGFCLGFWTWVIGQVLVKEFY